MNLLLLGVGRWGKNHLRVLKNLKNINLYVCDKSEEVRSYLEEISYKGPFSKNFKDFINEVEAVDIVTSADTHYELANIFLDEGKHIFIEKPICLKSSEAFLLAEKARRNGLILQVGHIFRFHPLIPYIKKLLPEIGKLLYIKAYFKGFKRPRTDTGVTMTDSIHFIDLINFVTSEIPSKVSGFTFDNLKRGMDDISISILIYSNFSALVESGYFQPRTKREITFCGERGQIIADFRLNKIFFRKASLRKENNSWVAEIEEEREIKGEEFEPLKRELEDFISCIKNSKSPICSGYDGAIAVKIVEKIYESSKKGKIVEIGG